MSYNRNFNNNFFGSNFTFRFVPDFPPPPLPPPILPLPRRPFVPPQNVCPLQYNIQTQESADRDYIKTFEMRIPKIIRDPKPKASTVSEIREKMQTLVLCLRSVGDLVGSLRENIDKYSEEEWTKRMKEIELNKGRIDDKLKDCTGLYLDMSRRVIAKCTAKRLRLKRLKEERKTAKKERWKLMEERSRKIDENLQKIKDDILKAKQEEQAKLEADTVLREVARKKQDAKKCTVKLDALSKLRKARQNTAGGRGEAVSEKEAASFLRNIDKLKTLWNRKLLIYDDEEAKLRAKLAEHASEAGGGPRDAETAIALNLDTWREALFGDKGAAPQEDFHGDLETFVSIRSKWDQYLNDAGTPVPVGWVVPHLEPRTGSVMLERD